MLSDKAIRLAPFMKMFGIHECFIWAALCLCFATQCLWASNASTPVEEKFASLQVGGNTYQNVTVTTKAKNYIYITHSRGMTSIKTSELTDDIREKLGYATASGAKWKPKAATAWAKQAATQIDRPEVKRIEAKLQEAWNRAQVKLPPVTPALAIGSAAGLLIAYLFFCHCCKLICQKTGKNPGPLVWLPLLKLLPLLQAASMSRWLFVLLLVPGLNLVAYVAWCFKIVQARGKTLPLAILLLLPVTNVFAFLYLAFSGASAANNQEQRLELVRLQTA